MAINDTEWGRIFQAIEEAQMQSEIVYGKVIKRDKIKGLVWLKEFGDQPIPLVGFRGKVKVYDTTPTGVKVKKFDIDYEVPKIGEIAVVTRQLGSRRLPKCVGVILTKGNFVID